MTLMYIYIQLTKQNLNISIFFIEIIEGLQYIVILPIFQKNKKTKKNRRELTTWIHLQAHLKQRCTLVRENEVFTVKKKAKLMLQNNDPHIVQK